MLPRKIVSSWVIWIWLMVPCVNFKQNLVQSMTVLYDTKKHFKLFKALSQKLKFSLNPKTVLKNKTPGTFGCSRKLIKQNYRDLLRHKRADFITHIFRYYHKCYRPIFLRSRSLFLRSMVAVVPRLPIQTKVGCS